MHAQGHSHILTSTVVRSLGIVMQYCYSRRARSLREVESNQAHSSSLHQQQEISIPSPVANMFGFGLIGDGVIVPRLKVSGQWEIGNALDELDATGDSGSKLRRPRPWLISSGHRWSKYLLLVKTSMASRRALGDVQLFGPLCRTIYARASDRTQMPSSRKRKRSS
jgi:hypothetical protein